jgi:hypothetical protein
VRHCIATIAVVVLGAGGGSAGADYQQWAVRIGMLNGYTPGYSDLDTKFGVREGAQDQHDPDDLWHPVIDQPRIDTAWIYVADRGGNGGWNELTGQYEEYPWPGLKWDRFAPFGPGTEDPHTLRKTWAVEVHAPSVGYTWDLRWQINDWPGWEVPGGPFAVRILPNQIFPDGLELTGCGDGWHWVDGLPQWGQEPQLWLIEAGIVPEPGLTCLAVALALTVAAAIRRQRP